MIKGIGQDLSFKVKLFFLKLTMVNFIKQTVMNKNINRCQTVYLEQSIESQYLAFIVKTARGFFSIASGKKIQSCNLLNMYTLQSQLPF